MMLFFFDKLEEMWNIFNLYLDSCKNEGWTSPIESVNSFMTAYHIWDTWLSLKDLDLEDFYIYFVHLLAPLEVQSMYLGFVHFGIDGLCFPFCEELQPHCQTYD